MASFDEASILELGKTPISDAAPGGEDIEDDEDYMFVTDEIKNLGRIDAEEPDWDAIEHRSIDLLSGKAKDVRIAAALALALFRRARYSGLAAGIGLCNELTRNLWDGLFPTKVKRRRLETERLTDRFIADDDGWFSQKDNHARPDEFDAVDLCLTRIGELDAALTERTPDAPPDFAKFIRRLKAEAAKRPAAAPAPTEPSGTDRGDARPAAPADLTDPGAALDAAKKAAAALYKADPTDPIPYAMNRAFKWTKMSLPTTEATKFQIDPGDGFAQKVDALRHQLANSLWDNLLKSAEAAFRSSDPLWLDLQRYCCAAMAGLGPKFDPARHAVMSATAGLVDRLGEGVLELKFKDGTPLCDGETRMWIESEVAPPRGGGGGPGQSDSENGKLAEATDKAKRLAGSGKLKDAMRELQEGMASCTERRGRFLWRVTIARLCYDAQRLQLAAPLLEDCFSEIKRLHIDEWEPALAVEVARTLYRCRKALLAEQKAPSESSLQDVDEIFTWLCQLDPLAALAAEP